MLNVPVYDEAGKQIGSEDIDAADLGGSVNAALLKQAVVMCQANKRQGHAVQKTRAEVRGSTRKLYRQKGTGNARAGNARTPVRRGGGRTFAKKNRDFRQAMPRKMRRLARNQAVLAKIKGESAVIIDGLAFEQPRTARFHKMLQSIHALNGCTFAINGCDAILYKSGRNIPRTRIMDVAELTVMDILSRPKLVFTREAFAAFRESLNGSAEKGD